MADLKELASNPDFQGLPLPEKNKVLVRLFPDYAGLPGPERMKVLQEVWKGVGSGQLQSMPEPPGFLSGFRESFGVPTYQEAKEFATKAYRQPKETAKQIYSDFDQISKFAYDNPGKFLWAMTNMPMFKEAWDKHNYREALGILAGTGVQAATVVGEAGKIGKLQRTAFKEGLTGKTAEAIKAEDAAKAAEKVRSQSEKLKLTLGERLGSPKIEKVEQIIRGMPGVGGRFEKIEAQRQGLIFKFRDAMSDAVQQLQLKAQPIYANLEENVPRFADIQQQRRDAYQVGRSLMKQKKYPEARQAFLEANELSSELKKVVEASGDANTVTAWEHADKLWSQAQAKQAVVDAIRDNTAGFDEFRPLARVQPTKPRLGSIIEDIKELDENGTLKRAIPNAQARDDFKTVADLYSRIQKKQSGYVAMRLLGYALLGTGVLGAHVSTGYLGELAGGYVLANMLAATGERAAGSLRLKNFLVAVDKGDLTRAETLAQGIAKSAEAKRAAEEAARVQRQAAGDEQLRRFREMMGNEPVPAEPSGSPQVVPADNPPELNRYAKAQEELALTRHLNEAIRRISATTKKALNDQELDWIGEQTGIDMTQPGAIGKARKALIDKRNEIRKAGTQ